MAITYVNDSANTNNVGTCTLGGPVSVGDLIVIVRDAYCSSSTYTQTATDNVNTGSYLYGSNPVVSLGNNVYLQVFWMVCNASGTPTVTFSGSGGVPGNDGRIIMTHWNGFVGTATGISPDCNSNISAGSTALNSGSFNTSQHNEFVFAYSDAGAGYSAAPSGWTQNYTLGPYYYQYSQIGVASGTPMSLSGTLSSSTYWFAITQGFYDNTGSAPPSPFYYRRNILYSI